MTEGNYTRSLLGLGTTIGAVYLGWRCWQYCYGRSQHAQPNNMRRLPNDISDTEAADMYKHDVLSHKQATCVQLSGESLRHICGYDVTCEQATSYLSVDGAIVQGPPFDRVRSNTLCLYAKRAQLWHSRAFQADATFEDNVVCSLSAFTLFSATKWGIDGFVFDVTPCIDEPSPDPNDVSFGACIDQVARVVRRLLTCLSEHDPSGRGCMKSRLVGKRGWVFSFNGTEMFVTVFASCYAANSARQTFGVHGRIFVLFQPYHSFLLHGVGDESPRSHTNWDNPVTPRDKIRVRFKHRGMWYFIAERPWLCPSALYFVPGADGSERSLVEWWKQTPTQVQAPEA